MAPLAARRRQWLPLPRWRCCLACQPSRPWRRKASRRRRGATCSGMVRQGCAGTRAPRGGAAAEAAPGRGAGGRARPAAAEEPQAPAQTGKPAEQAAPAPQPTPQPSACRLALTDAIAIAPSIPDIHGAGGCGGEDLVRLEAIVLPDKRQVSVKPAAILRCTMASALADWIRTDIAPLAAEPRQHDLRSRQFRFVRMPRPQPRRRRQTLRAWPRQCARCSRLQARQRPARSR